MPSFTIYQGEAGLRSENTRVKAENAKLKAENERLRALVGEPALAELAAAELQSARLAPPQQTGASDNCQFVIGSPAKAPVLNPVVARARGARPAAAQPVAVAPVAALPAPVVLDLPVSTQPRDLPGTSQEEIDAENAPSTRFQLIELHK